MQALSTLESPDVSRTRRSMLTQRVNGTLERILELRTFRRLDLGKARVGRITHRIHWHHDCVHRFVLDFDAGAVSIPSLLPTTLPAARLREVRSFFRLTSASTAKERTRLDPSQGELRVFEKHGSLTLSITVRNDAYEYCTNQLIRLADDVLRMFGEQAHGAASHRGVASTDERLTQRRSTIERYGKPGSVSACER